MTGFAQVFGGNNIYPVQPSYSQLNYSTNIQLEWPIEQAIAGALVLTDIVDLNPSGMGLTVALPDARQVSTGYTALFNNISGFTAAIVNSLGATLVALVPATIWQLYLIDNSTSGGTWRIFQFGAGVSVAVASALAGAGLTAIGTELNLQLLLKPESTDYTVLDADRAKVIQWTGGVGTINLPSPAAVGAGWFIIVKNQGAGQVTIYPPVQTPPDTIDGNNSDTLPPGASVWYLTDGVNYYTLRGGAGIGAGGFNLITLDVSGSGNFTLQGSQLNQIGYRFTGTLTGDRFIVVPNTTQEYWVDNSTTGGFNLYVGTAGQANPLVVPPGNRYVLYSDGTNVVNALTNFIAFPLLIVQGGTGATTVAGARANLGLTNTYAGLDDVSLSNLQANQIPYWNATAQRWENNPVATIGADGATVIGQGFELSGSGDTQYGPGHAWLIAGTTFYPSGGISAATSRVTQSVHGNWNSINPWISLTCDDGSVTPATETWIGGIGGGALVSGVPSPNHLQVVTTTGWIYFAGTGGSGVTFALEGYNTAGLSSGGDAGVLLQMNGNNNLRLKNFTKYGSGAQGGGGDVILGGGGLETINLHYDGSGYIGDQAGNMLSWDSAFHFSVHGTASLPGGTSSGVTTLQGLSDVGPMTPANGQYLGFNGTRWINVAAPAVTGVTRVGLAQFQIPLNASLPAEFSQNVPLSPNVTGTYIVLLSYLNGSGVTGGISDTPAGPVNVPTSVMRVSNLNPGYFTISIPLASGPFPSISGAYGIIEVMWAVLQ